MTRYEMEQKVKNYVISDDHKLEDYSDIEICSVEDKEDALKVMNERIKSSSGDELKAFCDAIESDTVDYIMHGCR